jgi:DUF438 domain-containing protein
MPKKKDITQFFDKEQKKLLKSLRAQVKELTEVLKLVAASQDVDIIRKEHMEFLGTIGSRMLNSRELELAKEGISFDDLRKICGRKMLATDRTGSLRDSLPHGHILRMVYAEHNLVLYYMSDLEILNSFIQQAHDWNGNRRLFDKLSHIVRHLCGMDPHHVREDKVIYPQLAAHGYSDVPQSIFAEHAKLHKSRVELKLLVDSIDKADFGQWKLRLDTVISALVPAVREHVYKEETLLYPKAVKVIQDPHLWEAMKTACDDIGICCF